MSPPAPVDAPLVTTTKGVVHGPSADGVRSFLGVPPASYGPDSTVTTSTGLKKDKCDFWDTIE